MKKISLASSILIGAITVSSLSAPLNTYASEKNVSKDTSTTELNQNDSEFKQVKEVKYLSNQQLFDELENQGYELTDIFTEEEIQMYQSQDMMRAGQTTLNIHNDGSATLYLSSAYTKTIAALGSGAATAIGGVIGLLGGGIGTIAGGSFGSFLGTIATSNIDTSKGIYINFGRSGNQTSGFVLAPSSWGYQ